MLLFLVNLGLYLRQQAPHCPKITQRLRYLHLRSGHMSLLAIHINIIRGHLENLSTLFPGLRLCLFLLFLNCGCPLSVTLLHQTLVDEFLFFGEALALASGDMTGSIKHLLS